MSGEATGELVDATARLIDTVVTYDRINCGLATVLTAQTDTSPQPRRRAKRQMRLHHTWRLRCSLRSRPRRKPEKCIYIRMLRRILGIGPCP